MKPAPLDHVRARSLEHAVDILAAAEDQTKVLAGGQSLIPLLAMRLAQPALLVDLNGLAELAYVREMSDHLEIGAMTRTRDVETSGLVASYSPLLPAALHHVGHVAIRNRGTLGGSVAHADPAAEGPAALCALDAEIVAVGSAGRRTIKIGDFFDGFLTTTLADDEIVTAIRVPKQTRDTKVAVQEFARRTGDFAVVAVFASAGVGQSGMLHDVRISVAGVGSVPYRARAAEELLTGAIPDPDLLAAAAVSIAAAIDPPTDIHGSSDYRRTLTSVLTRRCMTSLTATNAGSDAA